MKTIAILRPPLPLYATRAGALRTGAIVIALLAAAVAGCDSNTEPEPRTFDVTFDTTSVTTEGNNIHAQLRVDSLAYDYPAFVAITLVVTNVGTQTSTFCFDTDQRYDFVVRDSTEHLEVWRWSETQQFQSVRTCANLVSGDSVVYTVDWDMRDRNGSQLELAKEFVLIAIPFHLNEPFLTRPRLAFSTRGQTQ